ncbi:MAG: RDD family protein [Saprospiraceae bacterium]
MPINQTDYSSEDESPYPYASFTVRALASLVDFAVFIPFMALSTYNQLTIKSLTLELSLSVILLLYKPLMEWKYMATLGKLATKTKVIAEVGGPMTLGQSFVRSAIFMAGFVISILISISVFTNPAFQDITTLEQMVAFEAYQSYGSAHDSLGFIMMMSVGFIIFDPRCQGVHDKMGRTLVVLDR